MESEQLFFAHTLKDRPISEWEPLPDHLKAVAAKAASFAGRFGAESWGELLGRWHDLGKYQPDFQAYLKLANGFEAHLEPLPTTGKPKVDHSTPGAQHAEKAFRELKQPYVGKLLAYCIAGHHAGLADWTTASGRSGLVDRLQKKTGSIASAPEEILAAEQLSPPPLTLTSKDQSRDAFQRAIRLCALNPKRHSGRLCWTGMRDDEDWIKPIDRLSLANASRRFPQLGDRLPLLPPLPPRRHPGSDSLRPAKRTAPVS